MAKKLAKISEIVESSVPQFQSYLKEYIDPNVLAIIHQMSEETSVYLFSGVIRNFFLKSNDIRDVDIVLSSPVNVESYFKGYKIGKNSFGGYKIETEDLKIDLWTLDTAWAFQYQKTLPFDLEKFIPFTAFFNFAAVTYSFNFKTFYTTRHFLGFLQNKLIDVVYEPNANYTLCIVNTIYYSEKLRLKVKPRLRRLIYYLKKNM